MNSKAYDYNKRNILDCQDRVESITRLMQKPHIKQSGKDKLAVLRTHLLEKIELYSNVMYPTNTGG